MSPRLHVAHGMAGMGGVVKKRMLISRDVLGDGADLERARYAPHCARIDIELFGNDTDARTPRHSQSLPDAFLECGIYRRSSKVFSLSPCPCHACTDQLPMPIIPPYPVSVAVAFAA